MIKYLFSQLISDSVHSHQHCKGVTVHCRDQIKHYVLFPLNRIIHIRNLPVYTILHEFFYQRQVLNMWRLSGANLQHLVDEYQEPIDNDKTKCAADFIPIKTQKRWCNWLQQHTKSSSASYHAICFPPFPSLPVPHTSSSSFLFLFLPLWFPPCLPSRLALC